MAASVEYASLNVGSAVSQLGPQDVDYWPLWVNITVPLLSALAFAGVQALLLFVDDPGLRSAKRAGLYPRQLTSPSNYSTAASAAAAAASTTRTPRTDIAADAVFVEMAPLTQSPSTAPPDSKLTDAFVQCELLRPAASTPPVFLPHLHPQPYFYQQNPRQRAVSFGNMETVGTSGTGLRERSGSETMRMLEGMLLRPARRHTHQHQHHAYLRQLSESESRLGGAIFEDRDDPAAAAAAAAAVPATQSLTGISGRRLMHSVHHQYHQRLQARQMRYSTPVQPDRRALSQESGHRVPPTPPSSDRSDD